LRNTVFTTMLICQSDGRMTRPLADYMEHFEKIAATGLPIVLYLDRSLTSARFAANVTVVPTSIQDLELWQAVQNVSIQLPSIRNAVKDSADYLTIINAKTELVRRTIAMDLAATHHAFIDFGLFHVIRDTVRAQERLRSIAQGLPDEILMPGCFSDKGDYLDAVNWHFCGGLFVGPAGKMAAFAAQHRLAIEHNLPLLSWEVNYWAWMEVHQQFECRWLQADHDDSIVDLLREHRAQH
jgi:hypothetical protein